MTLFKCIVVRSWAFMDNSSYTDDGKALWR